MNQKRTNLIWGVVLIALGLLFLLENAGLLPEFGLSVWAVLFGGASLLFLVVYALNGWRSWGLLFPATILGAVALVIWLVQRGTEGAFLGSIVLWAVSLPFWVAFLANRKTNWWALIPGWATAVIGLVLLGADILPGEVIGGLVLLSIGVPFLVVYLANRENWWALIPAGILSGMGVVLLLVNFFNEIIFGALILFVIALPFFALFMRRKDLWWAIIPAGILTTLALVTLISALDITEVWQLRLAGGVLFLGIAVPFTYLWTQRERLETDWAKYPAVGFGVAGLLALVLGTRIEIMWAVVLIVIGVWLTINAARRPHLKG